jgi:hypothetical protein
MALWLVNCNGCHRKTSTKYARTHEGKCKACTTGIETPSRSRYTCPDCGGPRSSYQARHNYVCDTCCRNNDPEGYRREVMGLNDY